MENFGKILVIDDDSDIGLMMKMILMYKGYSVVLLEKADEVEETLSKHKIDLIFMDMLLSGINGTDVCAKIKSNSQHQTIPLIMMSAHPDAKKICFQAGANDFISKPFDTHDLLAKVANLMKNSTAVS